MRATCGNIDAHSHLHFAFARGRRRPMNAMSLTLLALLALLCVSCAGDVERKQLVELRKIANQTPLYPGLQKNGEKAVLKRGMVYFNTYYRSNAEFSDIKAFYDRVLAEKGWGPPQRSGPSIFVPGEANWVTYRQGEYVIAVEQDERKRDNFDIVFIWDPQ